MARAVQEVQAAMKCEVSRAVLQEALGLVSGAVATRSPKPILECVKLSCTDEGLLVSGTDLQIGLRVRVPQVEVSAGGEALVPLDRLQAIVRESPDETLELETEDHALHVRGSDSHYRILGQDPREFPPIPELEGEPSLRVRASVLTTLVERTLYAAAKENTRYAINGVLWEVHGKKVSFVATDGRRLAHAVGSLEAGPKEDCEVIVPSRAMQLLGRILDEPEEVVEARLESNQILVRCPRWTMSSVLVEGHFPRYRDVIPTDNDKKIALPREELLSAVRRAALLTTVEYKGVRFQFSPDGLVLSSRAPDQGEATISVPLEYPFEPLEIAFNPAFLTDALRVLDTDEVQVELKRPDRPAVIRAGSDFEYVVMPITTA